MSNALDLGQVSFSPSYKPYASSGRRHRKPHQKIAAPVKDGAAPESQAAPMFALAAGQVERPLKERSSFGTTVVSSFAHGAVLVIGFVLLTMSDAILLPTPQDTSYMVAMLVAAPPPPPPPAPAAPAPAAATPAPAPTEQTPQLMNTPPPQVDLAIPVNMPEEARPEVVLAPPPSLSVGFGSGSGFGGGDDAGTGSGFGVEGGVGWGQGTSGPGIEPVRVRSGVDSPELVHRVEPVYPPNAVADRVEGVVVVEATVDDQGHVQEVRVLRSIGPLDQAAIDAVMQWRYLPLLVNDQPSRFVLTVNVTFRLH